MRTLPSNLIARRPLSAGRWRGWLAAWAQDWRRNRGKLPAPVLLPKFPSLAAWEWPFANPYQWKAYHSVAGLSGGAFVVDDVTSGAAREYAPDGGQHPMFIVGVDAQGREVTRRSNVIVPDNALFPAPVIAAAWENSVAWEWTESDPHEWWVFQPLDGDWMVVAVVGGAARSAGQLLAGWPTRIVGVYADGRPKTETSNTVDPGTAQPPVALLNGLASYWNFDSVDTGLGYVYDSHGANNLSGPLDIYSGGPVSDYNSADTAGSGSLVSAADVPVSGHWTVASWVQAPTWTCDLLWAGGVFRIQAEEVTGLSQFVAHLYDATEFEICALPSVDYWQAQMWSFVALVRSGTTVTFYVNGSAVGAYDISVFTMPASDAPITLGDGVGKYDELGVWNRALTGAEVAALYNSGAGLGYGDF